MQRTVVSQSKMNDGASIPDSSQIGSIIGDLTGILAKNILPGACKLNDYISL